MTDTPSDREIAAVIQLPPPERYAHLIKRVADTETIWSLRDESGWALAGDGEGRELVPVWPHASYAAACALETWSGHTATAVGLGEWLERWLPGMARDGRLIAAFPVAGGQYARVDADRMRADLERELEAYE